MLQLIFTLYNLIFAALFFNLRGSENSSYSSEEFDESFEVAQKSKSNTSAKKKKPKRNRSAFIIFSSEMRAKLRNEHKEKLNSNEMMVKLAELWKSLGEDEKKKYYDQAETEKQRYNAELHNFYQQNPFEVIQNKTKKNHIKKPCSAYAIYLKETKKDIKAENPDLKMADILKVVAEKWKKLSDTERIVFQKKALIEKEITQAKINQQQGINPDSAKNSKKESKKQTASNSKRSHPSIDEMVKIDPCENQEATELKVESIDTYPEPALFKQQVMNYNYNNFFNQTVPDSFMAKQIHQWENEFIDFNFMNQPQQSSRFSPFESNIFPKQQTFRDEFTYNGISNLLSYLPQNTFARPMEAFDSFIKQTAQEMFVKRDEFNDEDEHLPSTASLGSSSSNEWQSSARSQSPYAQDSLVANVDDFKLDDQEYESYDKIDYWTNERCI